MATTYNHATTVQVKSFKMLGKGMAMAVWGPAKKRKAVRITQQAMLDLKAKSNADS